MLEALATAVLLGAVNTLVDFVSMELKLRTYTIYAAARIILVCYIVGTVIGARARQLMIGTVSGLLVGALTGGIYYLLAPAGGQPALVLAWVVFWIAFALLQTLLHGDTGAAGGLLLGAGAAAVSGMAYFGLSTIGAGETAKDLNYLRLLIMWTGTFVPGFVVLFWHRS